MRDKQQQQQHNNATLGAYCTPSRSTTGFFGRDQVLHTRPPGHGRGNGRREARLERRHERPARPSGLRHTGNVRAPPLASLPQGMYVCIFSREDLANRLCRYFPRDRVRVNLGRQFVDTQLSQLSSRLECTESVGVLELSMFAQFLISHYLESELQCLRRPILY